MAVLNREKKCQKQIITKIIASVSCGITELKICVIGVPDLGEGEQEKNNLKKIKMGVFFFQNWVKTINLQLQA